MEKHNLKVWIFFFQLASEPLIKVKKIMIKKIMYKKKCPTPWHWISNEDIRKYYRLYKYETAGGTFFLVCTCPQSFA